MLVFKYLAVQMDWVAVPVNLHYSSRGWVLVYALRSLSAGQQDYGKWQHITRRVDLMKEKVCNVESRGCEDQWMWRG
jgi:hypothetical protein